MKKFITCLFSALFFCVLNGQVIPVKNSFQSDLAKVIAAYPGHFKNIIGEMLVENLQSTDYKSRLIIKDAEECIITKYSAAGKEIYSWQALMMKTENFADAEKKFKTVYNSLNNLSAMFDDAKIIFKGKFEKPAQEKKFTSIVFSPAEKENEKLKIRVELLLLADMMEWVIKIQVYEKEKEDYERGPTREN